MPSFTRLRSLFRRRRMERELDAELLFHLDMQTAEYVRQGMSPERARRAARQLFGGLEQVKDDVRDTWLTRLVETCLQDARYSARSLRRHAGYTAAVIVTMALGIGANSAIFSVVNAVVLQPLPYERGEDLLLLRQEWTRADNVGFSLHDIDDIKALSTVLDAVVEYHNMYFILLGGQEPARVATGVVSWDYFDVLGLKPLLGRTFRAEDDRHDAPATLVLSYEYWQRTFQGDPHVVGRVFQMNDRPHTVIGVLPDVPMYPQPNDVYMPRTSCPFRMSPRGLERRGGGMASALGRRRPGASLEEVRQDLARIDAGLQQAHPRAYPVERGHHLSATFLRREFTRNFETTLLILLSTSGFVLLIVCASVANLSVARTRRRDRELALRTALGASRVRLLRQLLTESVILSAAGGAAGLLLAFVGRDLLVAYAERFTMRASEIRVDATVLLFTLGIALATGLVAGTLPAFSRYLRPGRPGTCSGPRTVGRRDLRRVLIVAQVAASFMLLIGAGLMVRSLMKLTGVDPGFSTDHVLTMQIDLNFSKYVTSEERLAYLMRLTTALRRVPGVTSVGASGTLPFLEGSGGALGRFVIDGAPPLDEERAQQASLMIASDEYFRAMGIPLLRGRSFTLEDDLDAPHVAIVNTSLADRYWPGADPVGQRISGDGVEWHTIVGVVANVRQQLALEPVDEIYSPLGQLPYVTTNWAIRSSRSLDDLSPQVRRAVYDVDPDQPIHRLRPLDDVRVASLAPPRLTAALLGLFAALALAITATGIAGVIAFSVNQRTQEFGVRVALGARRTDVVSMVVGEGVRLALSGLAIGAVGALFLSSLLSTLLFGIAPTDGVTYLAVSVVLLIVAALACLLPALRAASVDPMQALRTA
jgi:putative ABC transport system permease protein